MRTKIDPSDIDPCALITTGPTRGEAELDVFITMNDTNISNSIVLDPKLSDHKMNVIEMKFTKKEPSPTSKIFKRNYSNINYSALGKAVTETTFIDEDAHVDDQVRAFTQHHLNIFNSMAPSLSIAKKNHKLGLTKSTLDLMKKRNAAFKTWNQTKNESSHNQYKLLKSECKKQIRLDSKDYYNQMVSKLGVWKAVQSFTSSNVNHKSIFTPTELNKYIAEVTSCDFDVSLTKPTTFKQVNSYFTLPKITPGRMIECLKAIKKRESITEDAMGLSPKMIKLTIGCPHVFDSLLSIINNQIVIISSSHFPTQCKKKCDCSYTKNQCSDCAQ